MSDTLNIDKRIAEIDSAIEIQEWYIKRAQALERLKENEDFQLVILDGYINVEADRIYTLLLAPQTVKKEDKEIYLTQLDAIKSLVGYLGSDTYAGIATRLGQNAVQLIEDNLRLKQELLANKGE